MVKKECATTGVQPHGQTNAPYSYNAPMVFIRSYMHFDDFRSLFTVIYRHGIKYLIILSIWQKRWALERNKST